MGGAPRARSRTAATAWLTPAHLVLLGGLQAAVLAVLFAPLGVACLVLGATIVFVWCAGRRARTRLFGPAVTGGAGRTSAVALLFEVPGAATRPLLGELERAAVRAAFVVSATDCDRDPDLVGVIVAAGHELVATTSDGKPTRFWTSPRAVRAQVLGTFRALERRGGPTTRAYLPPRGLTHVSVRSVLLAVGAYLLLPRLRWDGRGEALASRAARGDVLLLTSADHRPLRSFITALRARGLEPQLLSTVLERPVLSERAAGAVDGFYDSLAAAYDLEQAARVASPVRRVEAAVIEARLPELVRPGTRTLELGAGTGRFTQRLAALGARVTAVDLSREMLARLRARMDRHGHRDVTLVAGDFMELDVGGDYALVCSFSCFEYVADLDRVLATVATRLAPGGRLFFTTARRGFFRFFVQLGNAMRQGLWLTARSEREVRAALAGAGFVCERIESHALKLGSWGGMLLAVVARKGEG